MSHTITVEFDDSHILYHTAAPVRPFRDPEASGRFDPVARLSESSQVMPDLALASPDYENGSILWCSTGADALMLRAIHRAEGYSSEILWDNGAENDHEIYAVLTSWDASSEGLSLSDEVALLEVLFVGDAEDVSAGQAVAFLKDSFSEKNEVELLADPQTDDHDDHFHIVSMVKMRGLALPELLGKMSESMPGQYAYKILAEGD